MRGHEAAPVGQTAPDVGGARRTEDPFRLIVEAVNDYGIFMLDLGGHVMTWNPGAERMTGYSADEIIGKHVSIFSPSEDVIAEKIDRALDIARREGRFEEEGWRLRKDGARIWANVIITPIRDHGGNLIGYAEVTKDFTKRREAEEEAQRFRLLVESVKDYAIFILDPKGHILTWNLGAERIKGYQASEIIGKHFSIFYPPEDIADGKTERELDIASRVGRFEEEGWRLRKDGCRMWASVTITAMRNSEGRLIGFAKVTRDLSERRQAEEETRRFRLLVETVKDYAIFILDPTGHVTTWNVGAERVKGYTAREIIGKHFSIFYPPEDIAAGKCEMELRGAAQTGRYEDEGWRLRKDGSRIWANVVITALRNPDGTLLGFAKVTRDLTARRRAEEAERALAAERAAMAEKSRTQEFQERFLAILGHDLRNPLASIDMGAGILRQISRDPATTRVLDRVQSSSQRMSRMIAQILDLTRARLAGGLELNPQPMDLAELVVHIVDELRAIHRSRTIHVDLPPLKGSWDLDRLGQVFSNLVGNALQYGDPTTPVTITGGVAGDLISIDVHNEGEPIPDELRETIFSPFRRGERDSRTAKTEGLGLGLYISREVAVAHGGDIEVRSSQADGTTFRTTLPGPRPLTTDDGGKSP